MPEVLCEVECAACGEIIKIYELGFTECKCGRTRAELKVELEILEDEEDD